MTGPADEAAKTRAERADVWMDVDELTPEQAAAIYDAPWPRLVQQERISSDVEVPFALRLQGWLCGNLIRYRQTRARDMDRRGSRSPQGDADAELAVAMGASLDTLWRTVQGKRWLTLRDVAALEATGVVDLPSAVAARRPAPGEARARLAAARERQRRRAGL